MDISAVICTHNGAKTLHNAIHSLMVQTLDSTRYEIIVVDNASTDTTRHVIDGFMAEKWGGNNFVHIHEARLGLSCARNTGWRNARGTWVAFLDDDAVAQPEWLETLLNDFTSDPEIGALGGKVEPQWESEPPDWMNAFFMRYLSIVDWSESPLVLDASRYLVGANIAFPVKYLAKFGGFCENLGRKGGKLVSNEEIELLHVMHESGLKIYYDPRLVVKHFIRSSRLNSSWYVERWFYQGVSEAIAYTNKIQHGLLKKIIYAANLVLLIIKNHKTIYKAIHFEKNPEGIEHTHKIIVEIGYLCGMVHNAVGK